MSFFCKKEKDMIKRMSIPIFLSMYFQPIKSQGTRNFSRKEHLGVKDVLMRSHSYKYFFLKFRIYQFKRVEKDKNEFVLQDKIERMMKVNLHSISHFFLGSYYIEIVPFSYDGEQQSFEANISVFGGEGKSGEREEPFGEFRLKSSLQDSSYKLFLGQDHHYNFQNREVKLKILLGAD